MVTYLCIGLLLLVSAAARAVADSIAHHNSFKSKGWWWDSDSSWKWKYKNHDIYTDGKGGPVLDTPLTPKFWGSTSVFVAFTDAWHFFCMLRDTAWQVALVLLLPLPWYWVLAVFILGKGLYSGFFQLLYTHFNKQAA